MATPAVQRTKVFISYSHADAERLERLQIHLKPLAREGKVMPWDDTLIRPGTRWKEAIERALAEAKVAVLLVSADFLASDFIATNELPPLLARAEQTGAVILPVLVGPSRFTKTESLSRFQTVNPPNRPLAALSEDEQEQIWVRVTEAIEDALNF